MLVRLRTMKQTVTYWRYLLTRTNYTFLLPSFFNIFLRVTWPRETRSTYHLKCSKNVSKKNLSVHALWKIQVQNDDDNNNNQTKRFYKEHFCSFSLSFPSHSLDNCVAQFSQLHILPCSSISRAHSQSNYSSENLPVISLNIALRRSLKALLSHQTELWPVIVFPLGPSLHRLI